MDDIIRGLIVQSQFTPLQVIAVLSVGLACLFSLVVRVWGAAKAFSNYRNDIHETVIGVAMYKFGDKIAIGLMFVIYFILEAYMEHLGLM